MLDPHLLQTFVAVAEQRSFTRAASQLNRTQSAVSTQVRRLESQLDATLFLRTTAQVELTPTGEALLGYARRILALSSEAISRIRSHQNEGEVRLGIMDDYATSVMPPLLATFALTYPRIAVTMETGLTSKLLGRVGKDHDLVVAMHPKGQCESGELLRRESALWAASTVHAAEKLDPLPVALYPTGCLFREWAVAALDKANRPWRLAFVGHSSAAVEAVVAQGLAVAVMKSTTFPAGLRQLSRANGLPSLPQADIRLHRARKLSIAAELLATHMAVGIQRQSNEPDRAIHRMQ